MNQGQKLPFQYEGDQQERQKIISDSHPDIPQKHSQQCKHYQHPSAPFSFILNNIKLVRFGCFILFLIFIFCIVHFYLSQSKQLTSTISILEEAVAQKEEMRQIKQKYNNLKDEVQSLKDKSFLFPTVFKAPSFKGDSHSPNNKHTHPSKTFPFSTVGIETPGNSYNFTKVSKESLSDFDSQLMKLLKPYNQTDCKLVRFGDRSDGGYLMCENFLQQTEAVINIGVKNVELFGCQLSQKLMVPNYQYDCRLDMAPSCITNNLDVFTKACVGSETELAQHYAFYTLWDILRSRNLMKKHVVVKIGIQGLQYEALKYFPTSLLDFIDQLVLDVHLGPISPEEWGVLDIFKTLNAKFVSVNLHMNNQGCYEWQPSAKDDHRKISSNTFELTLVNRKLLQPKSQSRTFKISTLNTPSKQILQDCQINDS